MMKDNVYTAFNKDTGEISMSNIVYDDPDGRYGKVLAEQEYTFIQHAGQSHANLGNNFIWNGRLSDRPKLKMTVNKQSMSIKEGNPIVVKDIPKDATLMIQVDGIEEPLFNQVLEDTSFALEVDVPGIYRVTISRWPYRNAVRKFEVRP